MKILVSDYNINYIEDGSGPLVVLLHGWGSNLKCFTSLYNLLKTKYHVIALDLPGFGESDALKTSFSVDDYTSIVAKFIAEKTKCSDDVILIGHSYGGRIIIKLNSKDNLPFKITKNVLIDAAGIKDKKDFKAKFKIFKYKMLKKFFSILPISSDYKNSLIKKYRNKYGSNDYASATDVMKDTLVKSVNEDLTPYLNKMKETLLVWGNNDNTTPLWMANIMEKEINNSGLVVLNGGHFSFIDDPYKFLSVIKSYFNI